MGSNSTARMLATLTLLCLLSAAPRPAAAVTCGQVASALAPCVSYVRGAGPLAPACCGGVRSLAAAVRTTRDRRAACGCLKSFAGRIPGVKPPLAAGVPGKCRVRVSFPISASTDCSKIH